MMKRKLLAGAIGGFIGFIIGATGSAYLGLVMGRTFLGGLDAYKHAGLEGYELAAYAGAIVGALIVTLLGVKLALMIAGKTGKKK